MKTYHDIEQIMAHLSAQDEEILKQTRMIVHLLKTSGISPEQLLAVQEGKNGTTEGTRTLSSNVD